MSKVFGELTIASEAELNELVGGTPVGSHMPWPNSGVQAQIPNGYYGVVWHLLGSDEQVAKPVLIVAAREDQRRLFSRFAQIRSNFSPLSAWCHIVTPEQFEKIRDETLRSDYSGLEAAWAALAVAEACISLGRPVNSIKLASCLATETFVVGRTLSLWGKNDLSAALDAFEGLQKAFRPNHPRLGKLRNGLEPIWNCLAAVSGLIQLHNRSEYELADAINGIMKARKFGGNPLIYLREAFSELPELELLEALDSVSAEERLRLFDNLVNVIRVSSSAGARRAKLCLLAGYVATVAAGGASSIGLAEAVAGELPEITAWAYVIGSLGQSVTWTSAFDGLGRLIVRELMRPFHLFDPPLTDFSANEASILIDRQLSDPFVHLRIKQLRVANAAILPGVNVAVPFSEVPESRRTVNRPAASFSPVTSEGGMAAMADALLPYMLPKIRDFLQATGDEKLSRPTRSKSQKKLPLD